MKMSTLIKNGIAHAAEKKLVVFHGEQMYLRVDREADVGDVVVFVGEFLGNREYITEGKMYRVILWQTQPAFYDDTLDIIKVYEPNMRTKENVLVYALGSIERVFQ